MCVHSSANLSHPMMLMFWDPVCKVKCRSRVAQLVKAEPRLLALCYC